MIKTKRLIQMVRKWWKVAEAAGGNIKQQSNVIEVVNVNVAEKGHFVVYTMEKKRFMIPLKYLDTDIFKELFRMSEEVFGLPGDDPIRLPCDALFMERVVSTLSGRRDDVRKDLEKALLISFTCSTVAGLCCSKSITTRSECSQQLVHSFC